VITHVLLDLDGTLVDSREGIVRSLQHGFAACGLATPDEETLAGLIGPPFSEALPRLGLDDLMVRRVIDAYRTRYAPIGMFEASVYPGITDLLDELVRRGITLALATSKPEPFAEVIVGHFGLRANLAVVAGATFDESRGRKSEVVAHALGQLPAASAANTLMVGDREHDVHGAAANGLRCVGVTWGFGSRRELQEAGAWQIIDHAGELLDHLD
jgi:phosphoglycolate phosphatase